jgi:hypothetical protein
MLLPNIVFGKGKNWAKQLSKPKNTEGVQNPQTLGYQLDSQAFVVKKGENQQFPLWENGNTDWTD